MSDRAAPRRALAVRSFPELAPLQHPLAVAALLLLVFNDHWLKQHYPGLLSGKLSDVAGLVLLPLWLDAVGLLATRVLPARMRRVSLLISALFFTGLQLSDTVNACFSWGLAAVQWLPMRLMAQLLGTQQFTLRPVQSIADAADLLTLPALLLTRWVPLAACDERRTEPSASARPGRAEPRPPSPARSRWTRWCGAVLGPCAATCCVTFNPWARAHADTASSPTNRSRPCPVTEERKQASEYCHDGFFLQGEVGGGWLLVRSPRSITNGFEQPIASTANGATYNAAMNIGGTVWPGFIVGVQFGATVLAGPHVSVLDESLHLRDLQLHFVDFGPFIGKYFDPAQGTFVRFGFALSRLDVTWTAADPFQDGNPIGDVRGITGVLAAGHDFWLARQLNVGILGTLRVFTSPAGTSSFGPSASATFAWH